MRHWTEWLTVSPASPLLLVFLIAIGEWESMKRGVTSGKRLLQQLSAVIVKRGWRYPIRDSTNAASFRAYVENFLGLIAGLTVFGSEWMSTPYAARCHFPDIAFAVDDLDEALKGREVLIAPTEPSAGVRVAFILDDGAPVELLQFCAVKAVRPKAGHAAEQRAAPDDGAPAKETRRRR